MLSLFEYINLQLKCNWNVTSKSKWHHHTYAQQSVPLGASKTNPNRKQIHNPFSIPQRLPFPNPHTPYTTQIPAPCPGMSCLHLNLVTAEINTLTPRGVSHSDCVPSGWLTHTRSSLQRQNETIYIYIYEATDNRWVFPNPALSMPKHLHAPRRIVTSHMQTRAHPPPPHSIPNSVGLSRSNELIWHTNKLANIIHLHLSYAIPLVIRNVI